MTSDTDSPPSVFPVEAGNHAADNYNLHDDQFGAMLRNIWHGVQKITTLSGIHMYILVYILGLFKTYLEPIMQITAKITKWGNSLGLRINQDIADGLKLGPGQ